MTTNVFAQNIFGSFYMTWVVPHLEETDAIGIVKIPMLTEFTFL